MQTLLISLFCVILQKYFENNGFFIYAKELQQFQTQGMYVLLIDSVFSNNYVCLT